MIFRLKGSVHLLEFLIIAKILLQKRLKWQIINQYKKYPPIPHKYTCKVL